MLSRYWAPPAGRGPPPFGPGPGSARLFDLLKSKRHGLEVNRYHVRFVQ
jgi:hypothetical protein